MGAETVLPLRSLKTNCDLKFRLSDFAAEAETTREKPKKTVKRRVIFRTGALPMHLIGPPRKGFFTIFSIKSRPAPGWPFYPATCGPTASKTIRRRGTIWMRLCLRVAGLAAAGFFYGGCRGERPPPPPQPGGGNPFFVGPKGGGPPAFFLM